jgi:peptidoglycan LD-endopeptidase LytH
MHEPMNGVFTSSKRIVLDRDKLLAQTPDNENIGLFFDQCEARGLNPRDPKQRQAFNNKLLEESGYSYLIGQHAEDRRSMLIGSQIANEGRTIHLGVDIFCSDLEMVYAPCDGTIIRTGFEAGARSYGNYLIFQPKDTSIPYMFFGHLSAQPLAHGSVKRGTPIAQLGDYVHNENGGWSRHLHLQMCTELPAADKTPIGYSSPKDIASNVKLFPSPFLYFPDWNVTE